MSGPHTYSARNWAQVAVFVIGGLQAVPVLAALTAFTPLLVAAESLGRGIAGYIFLMLVGPYLTCTVPALILAKRNRYPVLALALCGLSIASTVVLWIA